MRKTEICIMMMTLPDPGEKPHLQSRQAVSMMMKVASRSHLQQVSLVSNFTNTCHSKKQIMATFLLKKAVSSLFEVCQGL